MSISRIAADGREQLTVDHLKETAEYASILGGKFRSSALVRTAALLHDMGKFSDEFVQYLRISVQSKKGGVNAVRRGSVIHATQGAKYVFEAGLREKELLLALSTEIIAICIAGHHGGLMDSISPQGETSLRNRLTTDKDALHYKEVRMAFEKESILAENLKDLMRACREELSGLIEVCKNEKLNILFMVHMLVKSVFSCLVDSDRYTAYCFEIGKTPEVQLSVPPWEEYAAQLEQHISTFPIDSEIACIRHDISRKCLNASVRPCGVYRLYVPTGGGKTLSSLRFALNHAKEHSQEHIIYVIPYLSVLDQTAKEIKKALQYEDDKEYILEHHSNFVLPDDDSEAQTYRLFTDRWDQPIIITTMVQFMESVYSHKGGNLRKLHNMMNAVLIFDEVQSLPIKCVHLFNDTINYLHTFGNCTALLCTATQPLIDKVERPIRLSSPPELIADTSEAFKKLKRTRIVDKTEKGGYSIEALRDFVLEKLDAAGNCLVILNTKKDAANLYHAVENYINENFKTQIKLVHLSTSMCPAHRLEAIDSMQEEGNKKMLKCERILCISTQLIEAGVDISFACVVRALAGLDSIAQAAGRCNRNGEEPNGRDVYIVNLAEENLSKLPDIKCGSDVTSRILDESLDDLLSHEVMDRYYQEYFYKRKVEMDYPYNNTGYIYDLLSGNKKGSGEYINSGDKAPLPALCQAFQTAGEQFHVIEKGTTSILVPYRRGAEIAEEYSAAKLRNKPKLLREMGRYSVSLYPHQMHELEKEQALRLIDGEIFILEKDYYDLKLGVVFQREPEFLYTGR
ncbi:MAG: CRISPR-associated helicase Cas3' [Dethiobacter sp.]|nr:CRISPR-associated helicase Cas3' [Dethiobacter sp.]